MKFRNTLLAAAAAISMGTTAAHAEIVIGVGAPITGQYASFGEQILRGAQAAVADINAAGGLLGEQLRIEVGDDACDPKQAVSAANQMARAGALVVLGHYCSGSSIPASQVYAEEGVIQITPASTAPALTEQGLDNVFRVCGRDDQQGELAGAYIAERFGDKAIAIIHDKTAYGKGLADETQKALNAAGVKEKVYEAITAGERDYSALVSKLKQEGIEVLYVGGYHTETGLITRQMRDQGMNVQVISGDATVTEEYWSITGDAGQGTLMTFGPDPRLKPEAKDVVEKSRAQGYEPEGYMLYTYASMQIFKQAVEAAGSKDMDAIIEKLQEGKFDTVLGTIEFDEKGDVTSPSYVFYKWDNGTYAQIN